MGDTLACRDPELCISIDVERDYRLDGRLTSRGIEDGLPVYLDFLRSHDVPHDLFVSAEVASQVPEGMFDAGRSLGALGCHGLTHEPGVRSYLNRKSSAVLERELRTATESIHARFGYLPAHFRAPNFSTSAETISVLDQLGYRSDSSVLPGRLVRRWRALPLLDHRSAPTDPYYPDPRSPVRQGASSILEVPITPNPFAAGSPLGLGFLHYSGTKAALQAIKRVRSRYVVFLAHSWEMVSWQDSDPVAPWVRRSSAASTKTFEDLLAQLGMIRYVNMDRIVDAYAGSAST